MTEHKVGTHEEWLAAQACKRRMGWTFPWVSSYGSDFNYDFGFAFTEEQMAEDEFRTLIEKPLDWLEEFDQTPKGRVDEFRALAHGEYEDARS